MMHEAVGNGAELKPGGLDRSGPGIMILSPLTGPWVGFTGASRVSNGLHHRGTRKLIGWP
jgi:hypothetical protein